MYTTAFYSILHVSMVYYIYTDQTKFILQFHIPFLFFFELLLLYYWNFQSAVVNDEDLLCEHPMWNQHKFILCVLFLSNRRNERIEKDLVHSKFDQNIYSEPSDGPTYWARIKIKSTRVQTPRPPKLNNFASPSFQYPK